MPHDKNGELIEVGDVLLVPVVVTRLQTDDQYCNMEVTTVEKMFPGEHFSNLILNTKQAEKTTAYVKSEDYDKLAGEVVDLASQLEALKNKKD